MVVKKNTEDRRQETGDSINQRSEISKKQMTDDTGQTTATTVGTKEPEVGDRKSDAKVTFCKFPAGDRLSRPRSPHLAGQISLYNRQSENDKSQAYGP